MYKKIFFVVIFMGFYFNLIAQNFVLIDTNDRRLQQYNNNLMNYFISKNENIVHETIDVYRRAYRNNILDEIDVIVIHFFYGIKIHDHEKYDRYFSIIKQSNIQRLLGLFEIIETYDLELHLLNHNVVPQLNDIYWTLYFSSENTKYLDRIIDFINNYNNETEDLFSYLTARAALFSFMANIKVYPTVLDYIQNTSNLSNDLKYYIINQTIDHLNMETVNYLRIQRENGIW
ncbi:MAG: hypothetical protein FWD47_05390 [Treponema sp.]|nr:hypothetical protein [Treponema sp.]